LTRAKWKPREGAGARIMNPPGGAEGASIRTLTVSARAAIE
jgi:hypothetical protein